MIKIDLVKVVVKSQFPDVSDWDYWLLFNNFVKTYYQNENGENYCIRRGLAPLAICENTVKSLFAESCEHIVTVKLGWR